MMQRHDAHDDILYPAVVPFLLMHLACLAAFWTGITSQALILCASLYWLRMFAIGAGYHRYFSHRSYATSRFFQFLLAVLAQSTAQKSVLWWAAKHRHHHDHSDTKEDIHSPSQRGFLYSHVGWIFARRHDKADLSRVRDLTKFPELVMLHRCELLPAVALGAACFAAGGWSGLVVGFFWSTVLVYHATFCINSLAHVRGGRRYVTGDDSRNNIFLALLTMGEGWHNNHHAFQTSARQGFRWWELDGTFYILKALSFLHVVWDLKAPPEAVLRNRQRLGSRVIERTAAQLASRFDAAEIAMALRCAMREPELAILYQRISSARRDAIDVLEELRLPHIPSREDILRYASTMLVASPSAQAVVDRAREIILIAVGSHLLGAAPPFQGTIVR